METGKIIRINYEKRLAIIESDERTWALNFSYFHNAPGRHGCISSVGDEVDFVLKNDRHIESINFKTVPDVQLDRQELSRVNTIDDGLIFGERVKPDCGCPILLGRVFEHPDIQVGTLVRHGLGVFKGKAIATNLRVIEEET